MFPDSVIEAVHELRRTYQGSKTCVVVNYPIIEIMQIQKDKELSIKLFYFPGTDTFEIQPMDSLHYQKISFYDYRKKERRWIRNKGLLFSTIKHLQHCRLWEMISNKDFLTINENNERASIQSRDINLQQILKRTNKNEYQ